MIDPDRVQALADAGVPIYLSPGERVALAIHQFYNQSPEDRT